MYTVGTHARRLLRVAIGATMMLVLCGMPLRSDVAHGDRVDEDPQIYLPLVMKRYCTDGWEDDFSDPTSGWPVLDDSAFTFEYLGGEYHVHIKQPGWGAYFTTWPYLYATNFILEVDGRSDLGIYGLEFGKEVDMENSPAEFLEWYSFELGPGNYWAIYKTDFPGEDWREVLDSGYSSYITSGMNHLKIVRDGYLIEAYVNGQLLSTLTDSSFLGSREVGLVALASVTATAHVYFDNFWVCPVDSAPGVGAAGALGTGEAIILQKGTPPTIEFWAR